MPHTEARKKIVAWLKDAHAMERSLEAALSAQAKHASDDPELRDRITRHIEETRRHATLVETALRRYGADTSTLKDTLGRTQAAFQGMMSSAAGDTRVKDVLTGIGAEHFEIACYRSLEAAARELADEATASMCQEIIRDEEAMAEFLEDQLPRVTRMELNEALV